MDQIHRSDCSCPDCGRARGKFARRLRRLWAQPNATVSDHDYVRLMSPVVSRTQRGPRR